jgi:hypothetical protein
LYGLTPKEVNLKEFTQMISLRLPDSDRIAIQNLSNRLYVRESDVYRFAINFFLNHFSILSDHSAGGSDLLLVLCEIRNEINHLLGLKKHQLEKIINGNNPDPEKFVAMTDIELFLMPHHLLKNRLTKLTNSAKNIDNIDECLKDYFIQKYHLHDESMQELASIFSDSAKLNSKLG